MRTLFLFGMEGLCFLLFFGTPFLFFDCFYESSTWPRKHWLQFAPVALFLCAFLSQCVFRPQKRLGVSLLILFLSFSCSLFQAIEPYSTVLRLMEWGCSFLLCFFIASFLTPRQFLKIFLYTSASATLISWIGIGQHFFHFDFYPQTIGPAATFLNKNFAAQYLVGVLPITLLFFFKTYKQKDLRRIGLGIALISQLLFLFLTKTRGAWIGFSLSFFWFLLISNEGFGIWLKKLFQSSKIRCLLLLGIFFFAWLGILGILSFVEETEKEHSSIQQRIAIWVNSFAILKEHGVLGIGFGNFYTLYPLYHQAILYDPTFSLEKQPYELHQDFLQLLVEGGIFSFLLWLCFLGYVGRHLYKLLFLKSLPGNLEKEWIIACGMGIIAILGHSCFSFPLRNPTSALIFWSWIGILFGADSTFFKQRSFPFWPSFFGSVSCLLAMGFILLFSFLSLVSNYHLKRAKLAYQNRAKEKQVALKEISLAYSYFPWEYSIWRELSIIYANCGQNLTKIRHFLEIVRKREPYFLNNRINLGLLYQRLGEFRQARTEFEFVLKLRPNEYKALLGMGLLCYREKNLLTAIFYLEKAFQQKQEPSLKESLEKLYQLKKENKF